MPHSTIPIDPTRQRAAIARRLVVVFVVISLWNCLAMCLAHHSTEFDTPAGAIRGLFACVLVDPPTDDTATMSFGSIPSKGLRNIFGGPEGAWLFVILCAPYLQLVARFRPPPRLQRHGIATAPLLPPPRSYHHAR